MTIAVIAAENSPLKGCVEKILIKTNLFLRTVDALHAWYKKQKNREITLIICDDGILGEDRLTDGEHVARRIRSHTDAVFSALPLILFGYEEIGERISRNPANWCWRYFARCIPVTGDDSKLRHAVADTPGKFHDEPPEAVVFRTKWAGSLHETWARIDEYLCFFHHHDPEQNYFLTAITRCLTRQNEISHPFETATIRRLIKAPLKRMETHDMKTAGFIGQITLLEGALLAGQITTEKFKSCVHALLHEKAGYPIPVIESYLSPCDTLADQKSGTTLADIMRNKTILLIDDHPDQWELVLQTIFHLSELKSIQEPFDEAPFKKEIQQADLVFLDLYFNNIPAHVRWNWNRYDPNAYGHYLLDNWFNEFPTLPVLLFTTSERSDQARRSLDLGANDFISKETSDDIINPQKVFRDFRSAVAWQVERAAFIKTVWDTVSWFHYRGCDVFNLREAVNAFYAQSTVFACRSNLSPIAQAIVSLSTFIEANQLKNKIKPHVVRTFVVNARNMLVHGNITLAAEIDLILLLSAFFKGFNQDKQAINLVTDYMSYLREHHIVLDPLCMAGYEIRLPGKVGREEIKALCYHVWQKICDHHVQCGNCKQDHADAVPDQILLTGMNTEKPNFCSSTPFQCFHKNRNPVPNFTRFHAGSKYKESVQCVYHGQNPKTYLFFDLLTLVLSKYFQDPAYFVFNYLAALRIENLYLRHFAYSCGPLDQLVFHNASPVE